MIDLKKIVSQLDDNTYTGLEEAFMKSKADNSLFLLKSYRTGSPKDNEILDHLNINPSSLYTLKSRLYDKIQNKLTSSESISEEELLKQVNEIHSICYNNSKEIAVAYLTKLEENLQLNDMHGELLVVYSALKQLHLFSDKYFHYSQLYNKQIAFNLTNEKSIEILGNFNRILMQYDFSRLRSDLETLHFLYKGIQEQFALNPSRQIELIKSIIEIELHLFTEPLEGTVTSNIPELLKKSAGIIDRLPYYSEQKQWLPVINFLSFEYHCKTGEMKAAGAYYEKLNAMGDAILNYQNCCIISKFFISRIIYLQHTVPAQLTALSVFDENLIDQKNMHLVVQVGIYNSMVLYYQAKIKEAINVLNKLLNNISLKDLHFININIKLTLSYLYIKRKDLELAETTLKSISRKVKSDDIQTFAYVNNLIKLLLLEINPKTKQTKEQQGDLLTLFISKNKGIDMLGHLVYELTHHYPM